MRGRIKKFLLFGLMLTLSPMVANADLIVVDFEAFPSDPDTNFTTGTEDGVSISASGTNPQIGSGFVFPSNFALTNLSSGETPYSSVWTFSLLDDSLFTFESFDLANLFVIAGTASVNGFLSGGLQGTDTFVATTTLVTEVPTNLFGIQIDTLVIQLTNEDGFVGMDNLSLNTFAFVPEPGTLALLGIGLLGMGAARRRKKA